MYPDTVTGLFLRRVQVGVMKVNGLYVRSLILCYNRTGNALGAKHVSLNFYI